ncbi:Ankyrin repeat domain-containing protein 17 [Taenia crassiceps]|uniref:Ankyrin repeat domain-containing protein 17 n=1 Tax=Taenia crassiceps TaxID=6207 RepID=A0ABR4PZ74_9CEST
MGNIEMMELLINNGAYTYLCDHRGNTPLHWAARKGNLAAVTLLCRADCTADARNMNNRTPLMEARLHGHSTIVRYLLQYETDKESQLTDQSGSIPLPATSVARDASYFALYCSAAHD